MKGKIPFLSKFLSWSAKMAGNPITFVVALFLLVIWLFTGLYFGFSNTWLLIINTIATINAALMVFIIQNTQIRESKALHLKIDELIRVTKEAENELIAIEEREEEELEEIKKKIFQRAEDTFKKRKKVVLMQKMSSAEKAIEVIDAGQRIFVHGCAATPLTLLTALFNQAERLNNAELIHLHLEGKIPYANANVVKNLKVANLFVGQNVRSALDYEHIDYLPCFLSEMPLLFRSKKRPIDVALIHVSPPDQHGFCSLGVSVDIAKAAVEVASTVIAQINHHMPRVHGDSFIHVSQIDYYIDVDDPLPQTIPHPITAIERKIGEHVANLIEDEATLQIGIGAVPDAILASLGNHKHLGIHSEMWSDGALALIESGAVDNSKKAIYPGRTVSGFIVGTQRLYDFIHDNPSVVQFDIGFVNRPSVIAKNPKTTAINSAIEIDLTGQICADSVGSRIVSGAGGQIDFMCGATLSKGGKPIIALTSRTNKGIPRIVAQLKRGAGVVTTRAHVHYVITEYGVVDLFGKTLKERSEALIGLAHPDDRTLLEKEWSTVIASAKRNGIS